MLYIIKFLLEITLFQKVKIINPLLTMAVPEKPLIKSPQKWNAGLCNMPMHTTLYAR
jgi:hypothetical protein